MGFVAVTFSEARRCVIENVRAAGVRVRAETVPLTEAAGRVLAEDVRADRDYPPLARSIRDGFAVRAADLPGELQVIGEVRAGEAGESVVGPGAAVEIMTGAPVPPGADAILMVEHAERTDNRIRTARRLQPGDFINPRGAEARAGQVLLHKGRRIDFAHVNLLAMVGRPEVEVYGRPRVAVVATGDEIVEAHQTPLPHQIRNSNAHSLFAQVRLAGGDPRILPVAGDAHESLRPILEEGLAADLLLLSGGVSAGKYDLVEPALAALGAEFYFDRVKIQPGQPLVFGRARSTFFFGLPGNPASTMVTFEIFARAALELLGGLESPSLAMPFARLTREFRHQPGLTRFLPAELSGDGAEVTPLGWQGSSDVPSVARANAFVVADEERERWDLGDWIRVLLKQ
jgi:molybdopterin molybdotransferase